MARLGRYRRTEVQVGLFALIGIAVLVVGLMWLRDFRFTKRYNVYKSFIADTGGLVPGDVVMVAGFRKGTVRSMHLLERGVEVDLAVEQDVALREDARAVIGTKGMLGERYVALDRGTAERRLPPGSMLQGRLEVGMADLMAGTGELVESARAASDDVRKIIAALSRATDDTELKRGLHDATGAATEIRHLLQANHDSFNASVENFRRASESLANITGGTQGDIDSLVADMRSAAAKVDRLMDALDSTARKTDQVASLLLEKDSTFGRLVLDRQLYDNLERVAARTDSLIADIRAHPKRFFSLSVF